MYYFDNTVNFAYRVWRV